MQESGTRAASAVVEGDAGPVPVATRGAPHVAPLDTTRCSVAEERLMLAVLFGAIVQLGSRSARRAAEAEHWILGDDDSDAPFSFQNVCEALGLDAVSLARGLLAARTRAAIRRSERRPTRSAAPAVTDLERRPPRPARRHTPSARQSGT